MELITTIKHLIEVYEPLKYFLVGAFGSIMFDLTLYFKKDLGLAARKKRIENPLAFGFLYVLSQTIYSSIMGGLLAVWVDHSIWLGFIAGFINSTFLTFVVKTFINHSTKKAFWVTIGKLVFDLIGSPLKKVVVALELLSNNSKEDGTKK